MSEDKSPIFVGRQALLSELKGYWRNAFHKNQGGVVFLVGEAGIGKTALIKQFSEDILKYYSGIQYAYAQCGQMAGDVSPYAPFVKILNELTLEAAKKRDNWFVEFMREVGPDILGLVPAAGSMLKTAAKTVDYVWQQQNRNEASPGQFGQQDIFQQFTDSILGIGLNKGPLLICIDDWQWADTSSTNLLFHMARQLSESPILLLVTYRPHDVEVREHPIRDVRIEMERYKLCASIELGFLDREDIVEYLNQRFPQNQFDRDFIDWLFKITGGNALFTTEYVNLLLNEKLLTVEGQLIGDLNQLAPPADVEAVLHTRIKFLDRDARDMLAYASVEGERFTTLVLSRILNVTPLSLIKRLRAIEETHQLIASMGSQIMYEQQTTVYHFVHALIHQALYNELEAEERKEINRLLLELLDEIYKNADDATKTQLLPELITHAAETQDHLAQARYTLAASRGAAKNHAHAEALKYCEAGLQALNTITKSETEINELRLRLLINLGWTEGFIGNIQQSIETIKQAEALARKLKDNLRLFWILNRLGFAWRNLDDYGQARNCYEEAISLAMEIDDKPKLGVAYRNLADSYWKQGELEPALEWAQKALAISEDTKNKYALAQSYHQMGLICNDQRNYDLALDWFQRSTAINEELENKVALAWNYMNIASTYHLQGRDEQSISMYQQALTICRETGDRRGEAISARGLGKSYLVLDEPDQAMRWYQNSLDFWKKVGNKTEIMWARQGIGHAYFQQRKYDQALEQYQNALALAEEVEKRYGVAWIYYKVGLIHKKRREFNEALEQFERALDIWQKLENRQDQAQVVQDIGSIYETQGKYAQALEYYQKAIPIQEELGNGQTVDELRKIIAGIEAKMAER